LKGIEDKLNALIKWFKPFTGAIISFSGGTDSSIVAYAAREALKKGAVAVTFLNPIFPDESIERARRVADEIGIKLIFENLQLPKLFYKNPINRCYICKEAMAKSLVIIKRKLRASVIVDGYQKDDLHDYTPGRGATVKHGVRSPLLELGYGKEEIRAIARFVKLSVADKISSPCLATRIPFGQQITQEKLHRIANAERIVKRLTGIEVVRVRDHNGLARIEVDREQRALFFDTELMDRIAKELKNLGFNHVSFDLEGYRRGSVSKPKALHRA